MSERLRLSNAKADLVKSMTDSDAKKLLQAIQDYKYSGPTPDSDDELPTPKAAGVYTASPFAKPRPTYTPYLTGDPSIVLVIGDLHAPFLREGYLAFCQEQQRKYNAGKVIFIGDIIDAHAYSYHSPDPDGMSAGQEYLAAKECLQEAFQRFPIATVLLGNHDLLIARKAYSTGLSKHFIRSLKEIYEAPTGWEFLDELDYQNVVYRHGGAGGNAQRMAMHSRRSTVQGHLHSEFFTSYLVSDRDAIFGCQVGCGIDDKAYAFAYGRPFPKKSAIGCAVILDEGKTPLNILMPL